MQSNAREKKWWFSSRVPITIVHIWIISLYACCSLIARLDSRFAPSHRATRLAGILFIRADTRANIQWLMILRGAVSHGIFYISSVNILFPSHISRFATRVLLPSICNSNNDDLTLVLSSWNKRRETERCNRRERERKSAGLSDCGTYIRRF